MLAPFVKHTHLKDSKPEGTGIRYVLTGAGTVPVRETVNILARAGYKGFDCFEWEKRWHPEIEEPEIALPQYAETMTRYPGGRRRQSLNGSSAPRTQQHVCT